MKTGCVQASKLPGNTAGHNCRRNDRTRIINGSFYKGTLTTCCRLRNTADPRPVCATQPNEAASTTSGSKSRWNPRQHEELRPSCDGLTTELPSQDRSELTCCRTLQRQMFNLACFFNAWTTYCFYSAHRPLFLSWGEVMCSNVLYLQELTHVDRKAQSWLHYSQSNHFCADVNMTPSQSSHIQEM